MARRRYQRGFVKPTGKRPRTWTGYWYVYEDGKRRQRSRVLGLRSVLTKHEAQDRLRDLLRAGDPLNRNPYFKEAAAQYLHLKSGDWSRNFHRVMVSLFSRHVLPFLGEQRANDILPTTIKKWLIDQAKNGSESLVKKCLTHVRAVFEMLIEDGAIAKNPTHKIKKPRTRKPCDRYLEIDECQRLIAAASNPRDRLIIRILATDALRPSELFALRVRDVEPSRLRIDEAAVPGEGLKGTKTEESTGYVPISADLYREIQAYIADSGVTDFLFPSSRGTPIDSHNYLQRVLKPLAQSARVKGVTHQAMRRTVATHAQKYGPVKSAQGLLRHADPATTLKHYQQTIPAEVVDTVERWDRELAGNVHPQTSDLRIM